MVCGFVVLCCAVDSVCGCLSTFLLVVLLFDIVLIGLVLQLIVLL